MPNNDVFAYDNLPVMENPSSQIIYKGFTSAPTNQVLWTPQTGNSIFLTGIEISSTLPLAVTAVNLQRAGNSIFLVARFSTTSPAPFVQSFFSPLQFNKNESISVTSTLTIIDITLFGYEL
jgi:hypothetical protein